MSRELGSIPWETMFSPGLWEAATSPSKFGDISMIEDAREV